MPLPTAPTSTSIVTEAFNRFGITSPTSVQIARAITEGLEQVKGDLMEDSTTWNFLIKTQYISTKVGVSSYDVPTDYVRFISARLMDGSRTGTARGGSTAICTLASADTGVQSDTEGKTLLIMTGAGSGQAEQIDDYNATTKVVTFASTLSTAVDNTSQYIVVDRFDPLIEKVIFNRKDLIRPNLAIKPTAIYHMPNDLQGKLYTNYTPDKVYGIEHVYYADLLRLDTSSTLYTTLLRTLRNVLTQGVLVWLLEDDKRYEKHNQRYLQLRAQLKARHDYGSDLANMQMESDEGC